MKQRFALISLLILIILALTASQAFAAGPAVKKTPIPPGKSVDMPEQAGKKNDKKDRQEQPGEEDDGDTDEDQDKDKDKDKNPNKPDKGPKMQNLRGLIISVDGDTLLVELKNGEQVSITLGEAAIHFPGKAESDLLPGMQVTVRAQSVEEGEGFTALSLHVIPGKPTKLHRVGEVTAYDAEAGTITVEGKHGTTTFTLAEDAKFINGAAGEDLIGKIVTIISPRDPAAEPSDAPGNYPVARGVVIH